MGNIKKSGLSAGNQQYTNCVYGGEELFGRSSFLFSGFSAEFRYLVNAKSPLMEVLCGRGGVERLLFFFLKKVWTLPGKSSV